MVTITTRVVYDRVAPTHERSAGLCQQRDRRRIAFRRIGLPVAMERNAELGIMQSIFRACLERSYFGCEPPYHQLDHGDSDPGFGRFGQGVEVLTQSTRAVEPTEGAFDDPAPLQDPKSLALPRPFHDRKGTLQNSGYPFNQLAGITSVCPDELQPRKREINLVSACLAPLRSWIPAEWTITMRSRPRTSTTMWRLRPKVRLPPS